MRNKIYALAAFLLLSTFGHSQATVSPVTIPHIQFFDSSGNPLSGGKLFTYLAGTTTPTATYSDSTGSVANTNPIILNSAGFADIWLDGSKLYKISAQNSAGVLQWTVDNLSGSLRNSRFFASDGTAAAPAYTFASETSSGAYRASAGQIAWSVLGTKRLSLSTTALIPGSAGGIDMGSSALPFGSIWIGNAATNNARLTGTFTAARTFTFPDVTDTLALLAATQTFTNKILKADSVTFNDPADTTKAAKFSISGVTTGKTLTLAGINTVDRTITFPDATDTVMTLAATQTGTNKTFTAPTITSPNITGGIPSTNAIKHQVFGATCTTGTTQGNSCTTSYTWSVAFPDTNYAMWCQGIGGVIAPVGPSVENITASGFDVRIYNLGSGTGSSFTSVHCGAIHN